MSDTTRTPAERRAFEKIEAERHAQAQWLGIDSHGQDLPTFHEGDRVVYVPYPGGPREHGTITSMTDRHAFVRYGDDTHSKATPFDLLTEAYPCGHEERTRGCGGCDPGAVEITLVDDGPAYWTVVTRYGGHKHQARMPERRELRYAAGRHFTLCLGTSSWTITEWERVPDHPRLTVEQMHALPPCPTCADLMNAETRTS